MSLSDSRKLITRSYICRWIWAVTSSLTQCPDTSRIYVALGYGFFLELTLAEALKFIDRKSSLLTELSDSLTKDSMNIKANIHMMLEGLRELQGLQNFPEPSPH
ncbi:protein UXT isoform X1 [Rattus norvegicus]|uniref:protein UXT isoform X1 n=1 Tax=Rattus norvegicus TaxID=10116 RepID=UPI002FD7E407